MKAKITLINNYGQILTVGIDCPAIHTQKELSRIRKEFNARQVVSIKFN